MNRILKFRAWKPWERRMIYDVIPYPDHMFVGNDENEVDPEMYSVMQYTGLKDKNGKEIYEGDIIKRISRKSNIICCVFWGKYTDGEYVNGIECWVIQENIPHSFCESLSEAGTGGTYGHNSFYVEVIGNKFENPELMEKI
jgi:uncharacterized phage protein (TIGR01671 family)